MVRNKSFSYEGFSSDTYVHVHKDTRTKLDSHSRKCIFIGYNEESKAYKVYNLVKKHVLINRDVVFKESDSQATKRIQEIPAPPTTQAKHASGCKDTIQIYSRGRHIGQRGRDSSFATSAS